MNAQVSHARTEKIISKRLRTVSGTLVDTVRMGEEKSSRESRSLFTHGRIAYIHKKCILAVTTLFYFTLTVVQLLRRYLFVACRPTSYYIWPPGLLR